LYMVWPYTHTTFLNQERGTRGSNRKNVQLILSRIKKVTEQNAKALKASLTTKEK